VGGFVYVVATLMLSAEKQKHKEFQNHTCCGSGGEHFVQQPF